MMWGEWVGLQARAVGALILLLASKPPSQSSSHETEAGSGLEGRGAAGGGGRSAVKIKGQSSTIFPTPSALLSLAGSS